MYILCDDPVPIRMFTADNLSPLGKAIDVEGMKEPIHIVACRRDRQLYLAEKDGDCIWRMSVDDHSYKKWLTTESAEEKFHMTGLSMSSGVLLVTSSAPSSTVRQYSTVDARQVRVVQLPKFVQCLWHGVETSRGTFVISHLNTSEDKDDDDDDDEGQAAVSELFYLAVYWLAPPDSQ